MVEGCVHIMGTDMIALTRFLAASKMYSTCACISVPMMSPSALVAYLMAKVPFFGSCMATSGSKSAPREWLAEGILNCRHASKSKRYWQEQ